jgi:hypothetical protein
VLCSAPPALLWERYKAMNAAVARGERAYLEAGGAPQPPMSFSDLAHAQGKFAETVGPHCTAIYESDRMESLDHTVRVVLRRLSSWPTPTYDEMQVLPELVIVEGSGRSEVAHRLAQHLIAWKLVRLQRDPQRTLFEQFLAAYVPARITIFDGAHLTAMAESRLLSCRETPATCEAVQLCQYVAARGAIVVGRGAPHRAADEQILHLLKRASVPFHQVCVDDSAGIAAIAAVIDK